MGTHRVQMKGSFLGWFIELVVPVQEIFCPALAALVGPVQNIFSLTIHYFTSFVPIAQQAGQAVVQRRLSLNKCLYIRLQKQTSSGEFPLYILFRWLSVCIQ